MSRAETAPVTSRMRSASVDLPWSMCAMIEKLRILLWSIDQTGYGLAFAVPVLEVGGAPEHVVLPAGPDADLVAVRVLRDPELVLRREDGDADRLGTAVADPVGPVGAGREADRVARPELPLALRRPDGHRPGQHDRPLLVGPLEVVRADRLAGRQLIDRHAE